MSPCLMQVAADTPCVSALGFQYCLALSEEDLFLFAVSLVQSGCTPTVAKETTLAVEECLAQEDAAVSNQADSGPDDLRRRNIDEPREPMQIRGTKIARTTDTFNVTVASAIVGTVLGLFGSVSMVTICFCCLRERTLKKRKIAAADAKAAAKAAAKGNTRN